MYFSNRYDAFGKRDIEVEELLQAGSTSPPLERRNNEHQDDSRMEIKKRRPRPFSALMNKNAKLQLRQWGTNVCQVITPLLVLMIIVILKIVVITQLGDSITQTVVVPGIPFPLNASPSMWAFIYQLIGSYTGGSGGGGGGSLSRSAGAHLDFKRDVMHGYRADQFFARALLGGLPAQTRRGVVVTDPGPAKETKPHQTPGMDEVANEVIFFLYSTTPQCKDEIGTLGNDWTNQHSGNRSGMLGRLDTHLVTFPWPNLTSLSVPYFLPRESFSEMQKEVFHDFNELNAMTFAQVQHNKSAILLTPDAIVSFYRADDHVLNYSFSVNDFYLSAYHRANNFTKLDASFSKTQKLTSFDVTAIPLQGELQMMSLVQSSYWLNAMNQSVRRKKDFSVQKK